MADSPSVDTALRYHEHGWMVFPCYAMNGVGCTCGQGDACPSPGKHPRPKRGVLDGIEHCTPDRIRAWWHNTAANIGVATGPASGIYVIDLDGVAGIAEWTALELSHGAAPTLMARTGGGGIHRYYQHPAGLELGNSAHKLAPHIDSRGHGGYVLAPPSNHRSGRAYRWLNRHAIAPLPGWVLAMLRPKIEPSQRNGGGPARRARHDGGLAVKILDGQCQRIARTGEGQRNEELFKRACWMFELVCGGELSSATTIDMLHSAGVQAGLPPYEVDQCLSSAWQHGRLNPRRLDDELRPNERTP